MINKKLEHNIERTHLSNYLHVASHTLMDMAMHSMAKTTILD